MNKDSQSAAYVREYYVQEYSRLQLTFTSHKKREKKQNNRRITAENSKRPKKCSITRTPFISSTTEKTINGVHSAQELVASIVIILLLQRVFCVMIKKNVKKMMYLTHSLTADLHQSAS